jgi:hypothetical protein
VRSQANGVYASYGVAKAGIIARVMEFFVTDLGDYVTGQNISVCGGAINF